MDAKDELSVTTLGPGFLTPLSILHSLKTEASYALSVGVFSDALIIQRFTEFSVFGSYYFCQLPRVTLK